MKHYYLNILPGYKSKSAGLINLNTIAQQLNDPAKISRFLDPYLTNRFLPLKHRTLGVDYSFGGYLEDRQELWRGSYLAHGNAIHLGIDINVPCDTVVSVKYPCKVMSVIHDPDQNGGWGSTALFALDEPVGPISHFLYAHLGSNTVDVVKDQRLTAQQVIGRLGAPKENGGWYEHLHVQAITNEAWHKFHGNLYEFDGYGSPQPAGLDNPLFPDPMPLL